MSQVKQITVFSFNELSDKAKEKVISDNYDINVTHNWWDPIYEDFKMICETVGVHLATKGNKRAIPEIYFDLDRANYAGYGIDYINFLDFYNGFISENWKNRAPMLKESNNFTPSFTPIRPIVLKCIESGAIDIQINYKPESDRNSMSVDVDYNYNYQGDNSNVEKYLESVTSDIEFCLSELGALLLNLLHKEYDWLCSRDAIIETIEANNYTFTESGKMENL